MKLTLTEICGALVGTVNRALEGIGLWFLRQARHSRIAPNQVIASRLSRITPLDLVNHELGPNDPTLLQEMERAWESD
jgi:hypothetical protein